MNGYRAMTLLWKRGAIALLLGMLHWISRLFGRGRAGGQGGGAMLCVKGSLKCMGLCPRAGEETMESCGHGLEDR